MVAGDTPQKSCIWLSPRTIMGISVSCPPFCRFCNFSIFGLFCRFSSVVSLLFFFSSALRSKYGVLCSCFLVFSIRHGNIASVRTAIIATDCCVSLEHFLWVAPHFRLSRTLSFSRRLFVFSRRYLLKRDFVFLKSRCAFRTVCFSTSDVPRIKRKCRSIKDRAIAYSWRVIFVQIHIFRWIEVILLDVYIN